MTKSIFLVPKLTCEGCSCGHCAQMLLIGLKCHKDIQKVTPNYKEKTLEIEFDKPMNNRKLISFGRQKGYEMLLIENQ